METRECDHVVKYTKADGTVVEYKYKKKYNAVGKHCGKNKVIAKLKQCNDERKIKLILDYIDLIIKT